MPKVTSKVASRNAKTKTATAATAPRWRNLAFTTLATPLNLAFIAFRVIWSGRRLRLAALAMLVAATSALIFRLDMLSPLAQTLTEQTYQLTAKAGFRVNDITVEGRKRTQREDLLAAINVVPNSPILALNIADIHARIEALPWIEKAVVLRRLPNIMHISLVEREPFAFYKTDADIGLIDRNGVTITRHHLTPFAHLPVFSGQGATLRAADFMDMLQAYPVLRNRMVAAHWNSGRRWTVQLDHGGSVHLPAHDVTAALDRLMDLEKDRRILAIENQAIDLRLPDRVLLRPTVERSSQKDKAKKETAS